MRKIVYLFLIVFILSACTITIPDGNEENTEIQNPNNNPPVQDEETIIPNDNENNPPVEIPPVVEEISYYGSDNDVYRINITTNNNEFPQDLENYINGSLNITEQDTSIILKTDMSMKIRLRGNSTSAPDKKPFKIKFDQAQSLFGLTAAKDWVLLANYYDKSNIRNYLAYTLANRLDYLGFQPSSIFIDVYLNGEYQGLYLLCEHIEVNEGRVDIANNYSANGISSFLIEVDDRAVNEYKDYPNMCYINFKEYIFTFKSPDRDNYILALQNNDQALITSYENDINWFKTFINSAYTSLEKNNYTQYSKYYDLNSFMDYYIVQEFFKNVDISSTSQYYIIDQGLETPKLACGPVWDFDIAAGAVDNSQSNIYSTYTNTNLYVKECDMYYRMLFSSPTFLRNFKARYKEVRPLLLEIIEEIDLINNSIAKAQSRNINKWPLTNKRNSWIELYALSDTYYSLKNTDEHINHLKNTLTHQLSILDQNYL